MADMLKQADDMQTTIDTLTQDVDAHRADGRHHPQMVAKTKDMTVDIAELRDNIANFDDFFRPHAQLPLLGTALLRHPGVLVDPVGLRHPRRHRHHDRPTSRQLVPDMQRLDTLMPQLVALMPAQIETMKTMKQMMLTMYATQKGMQDQQAAHVRRTRPRWATPSTTR